MLSKSIPFPLLYFVYVLDMGYTLGWFLLYVTFHFITLFIIRSPAISNDVHGGSSFRYYDIDLFGLVWVCYDRFRNETVRKGGRAVKERTYLVCDLKSFYASVECIERGLDPLTTNLVVADLSRTEKTICLAVTPSLKAWGISGRARLFEVVQRVREVNAQRLRSAPGRQFTGSSSDDTALKADPGLALDYIVAPPRMAHYMEWSTRVYNVYLKYIAPEDIHNYSIDEVLDSVYTRRRNCDRMETS